MMNLFSKFLFDRNHSINTTSYDDYSYLLQLPKYVKNLVATNDPGLSYGREITKFHGEALYTIKSTRDLIDENKDLISSIKKLLCFNNIEYCKYIEPILIRYIKFVSILPATEIVNDNDSGGLVRHTLLVIINMLENSHSNQFKDVCDDIKSLQAIFVLIAIMQGSKQAVFDYEITTPDGNHVFEIDSFEDSLEEFIDKHHARELRISFRDVPLFYSVDFYQLAFIISTVNSSNLIEYIEDNIYEDVEQMIINYEDDVDLKGMYEMANSVAACISLDRYLPLAKLPEYVKTAVNSKQLRFKQDGIYETNLGHLIEIGSQSCNSISDVVDVHCHLKNISKDISTLIPKNVCVFDLYESHPNDADQYEIEKMYSQIPTQLINHPNPNYFFDVDDEAKNFMDKYVKQSKWHEITSDDGSYLVYGFFIDDNKSADSEFTVNEAVNLEYEQIDIPKFDCMEKNRNLTSFKLKDGVSAQMLLDDGKNFKNYVDSNSLGFHVLTNIFYDRDY